MCQQNFDEVVIQYNRAMSDFFNGNPEPISNIYSNSDEISLAQLAGPFVLGRVPVTETASRNAMKYREAVETTFETLTKHVTPEFAYIVQIERTTTKIGGSNELLSLALGVTSIFQCEDNFWRLLHRLVDSNVFPPR